MQLRILDYNYPWQDATSVTASSSNSEFPVSNVKKTSRSKVWRSSATGNFVIDSTNNKLNFKESGGGAELTATLTSGTYTSTTLATEIKTQLEAVGAATYTVSKSATTGKWTIASDGAYLALLSNTGTNVGTSAWSALGFSTAADHTGAVTYTGSNIAIHTEEWVVIDLLSTEEIDTFALLFDPMRQVPLSSSAVLKIQGNATNVWSAPSVDVTVSLDTTFDAATYFWSASQSYRYWRVKVVDPANTNLYVELSKIFLGKATQLASAIQKNGWSWSEEDQSKLERTAYGHVYADIYPIRKELSVGFPPLTYVDLKTMNNIFRQVGRTTPILVSLDPTEEAYDKDHFLICGTLKDSFKAGHVMGQYFETAMTIEEVF